MLERCVAVTAGTVSNPLFSDDNHGRQLAGRLELRPVAGLILGTSSRGAVREPDRGARRGRRRSRWRLHADGVGRRRRIFARPLPAAVRDDRQPLAAPDCGASGRPARPANAARRAVDVGRGRYKLRPDFYLAARYDHLGFSDEQGVAATPVGRAGDAVRDRRRLFPPAQSAPEGFVSARQPRRRRPARVAHMFAAQLVCGSDQKHDKDAQRAEDTKRAHPRHPPPVDLCVLGYLGVLCATGRPRPRGRAASAAVSS